MKTVIVFLFTMLISASSFADSITVASKENRCRDIFTKPFTTANALERVRADFQNGTWRTSNFIDNNEENVKTFSFQPDGNVEIITDNESGEVTLDRSTWNLEQVGDNVFMVMSDQNSNTGHMFLVKQNCDGIVLTEVVYQKHVVLEYIEHFPSLDSRVTRDVYGKWKNIKMGSMDNSTPVFIELSPKRQLTKTTIVNDLEEKESGQWEITKDGKFLLLHFGCSETVVHEVYKIDQLDFASMTLISNPLNSSLSNAGYEKFSFEKI
jgi:outer membrane lipoprotein-sorting protein